MRIYKNVISVAEVWHPSCQARELSGRGAVTITITITITITNFLIYT